MNQITETGNACAKQIVLTQAASCFNELVCVDALFLLNNFSVMPGCSPVFLG